MRLCEKPTIHRAVARCDGEILFDASIGPATREICCNDGRLNHPSPSCRCTDVEYRVNDRFRVPVCWAVVCCMTTSGRSRYSRTFPLAPIVAAIASSIAIKSAIILGWNQTSPGSFPARRMAAPFASTEASPSSVCAKNAGAVRINHDRVHPETLRSKRSACRFRVIKDAGNR
jgi:hypothetical protein